MKNWLGTGGLSSSSPNLSASAPPFTVPRAFPYPNSTPYANSTQGSSVVPPMSWERDSWDCRSSTVVSTNRYLSSNHEVDADVPYVNYHSFTGPEISSEMYTQMPSWDLPVAVALTDCMVSHAPSTSNFGKDVEAGPCSSYSTFEVANSDSLLTTNRSSFVGSSAPKPIEGKSNKSSSDRHVIGFSSVSNAWDDRLDGSAVGYPFKSAQTDGKYHVEEEKLAGERVPKTFNGQDVWSNAWGGPAVKYPLESARVDGNNWLSEGQLAPQHLTGMTNGGVVWNDGRDGPAVEYPFKSAPLVGEESCHQAPHFDLATDIWKQKMRHIPSWEQSKWWHGPNTDYESLAVKCPLTPVARLRADAPSISVGLVTQSKCSNEIGRNNENFSDMIAFHSMESYPLLGTGNQLQFDVTYSRIQHDTNAFENLYMAKDEDLPKEKFSSKNTFDHMPPSSSNSRFSNLYLENSAIAASTQLACDAAGSGPWGFHSDRAAKSHFLYNGLPNVNSVDQPVWDGLYTQDMPIQCAAGALFQETKIANTTQAESVEGSRLFFKPPAVPYTSDGEQRCHGTVEAGSSLLKEIQSSRGTYNTTATEHDDLQVLSNNLGLNSCFPLQQNLNEDEKTPDKMHPWGDHGTENEKGVQNLANDSAEATSVLVKEISGSNFPAPVPWNLRVLEKGESAPKVDLQLMVLTLHNLSELLDSYCSTGKYEVREEDRDLLEKAIHNLATCSTKDVVLTAEKEELNSEEEPSHCLEGSTKLHVGQLDDPTNGDEKQVNSLCKSKGKGSLEMLSSGVDCPMSKDNNSCQVDDQILDNGKQQSLDEGKLCSETFSSEVNSRLVKVDNGIQAIKGILSQHFCDGHESDPQVRLFRNLWLEAEAELCSLKCKARFDRFKSKLDTSGIKGSSETASAVENPMRLAVASNFIVEDYFSRTRSLEKNQKLGDSPRSCGNAKAGVERDIMARFDIPDVHCHDLNSRKDTKGEQEIQVEVPQLKTAKDAEANCLTEKADLSPPILCCPILKGTTCCCKNTEDAVMSRFNILMERDESLSSKQSNWVNTEAVKSRFEQDICQRAFPEQIKAEERESSLYEERESPSPQVSESFVMSSLHIMKQCDENASSVENIVYGETVEVEQGEERVDEHGADGVDCLSPNVEYYSDLLSSGRLGEYMSDNVLDRLKILKLLGENQSYQEFVDLGSEIRGDFLSAFRERSTEEPIAKAEHVLRTETSSHADDVAKMDSTISSYLKGKPGSLLSGSWFDAVSLDWEHVLKEEGAGGTSEP